MSASRWMLLAVAVLALPAAGGWAAGQNDDPTDMARPLGNKAIIARCFVSLIETVKVPAEEAGILLSIEAHEGMEVEEGMLLGKIKDTKAQHIKRVAEAELKVAQEQATNDVNVRYSVAAAGVAKYEYLTNQEVNKKSPGAVPYTEIKKLHLMWEKARFQVEQAQVDQKVAGLTAEAKAAEVDAAEDDIQRRQIVAPLTGVVAEVFPHAGEWLNPGDPVLQIIRMDKLRIEGRVDVADFSPDELINRPVQVEVLLARGRKERFDGKITFIHPTVTGGSFRVRAEIVNRSENGQWLLRAGHQVAMTIETGAVAVRPAGSRR